jgi:hypothetical protein
MIVLQFYAPSQFGSVSRKTDPSCGCYGIVAPGSINTVIIPRSIRKWSSQPARRPFADVHFTTVSFLNPSILLVRTRLHGATPSLVSILIAPPLGKSVFSCFFKLTSVTFDSASNLTDIPDRLFYHCTLLTRLCLLDSMVKIVGSSFAGMGITSLTTRGFSTTGSVFNHTIYSKCQKILGDAFISWSGQVPKAKHYR